jgi:type IV secretory pathway TraG/TraD family ATPase VirD4
LQSLKYLKPCERNEGFSIRQWVQNADSKIWVFLTSVSEHHEVMKPLISAWLDIAVRALLSASPSSNRRLWFILDELPSLERVPCLSEGLAESRKFGGCFLLAMQSMAQLKKIYGSNGAQELSDLCNTRIFFRDPSFETAHWASRELGEVETEENRENISYSESAMRSGVSISGQRYQRQVISPTEIMKLRDLEAFVRLSGSFPLTKIRFLI